MTKTDTMRLLRLRMLAVRNSTKALVGAGGASIPARISAGDAATASSSVRIISSLGSLDIKLAAFCALASWADHTPGFFDASGQPLGTRRYLPRVQALL